MFVLMMTDDDELLSCLQKDRVAIHEVMEQQTVTIAKAGIHASLNARCSVLAAANPIFGQYDRSRRPQENIGLPDSLLSRFDMLFIVLDQLDPTLDRKLAEHVVKCHQYRRAGVIMEPEPLNQTSSLNLEDPADEPRDTPVWMRAGGKRFTAQTQNSVSDILTKDFLKKYIHYAKSRIHPELSAEAMESIAVAYGNMRAKQTNRNFPVTARSLETLIRVSSAHAKARLSVSVEEEDVEGAVELINYVMFHEVTEVVSSEEELKQDSTRKEDDGLRKRDREATVDESLPQTEDSQEFDMSQEEGLHSSKRLRDSGLVSRITDSKYDRVLATVMELLDRSGKC